jgi:hypothetical protein
MNIDLNWWRVNFGSICDKFGVVEKIALVATAIRASHTRRSPYQTLETFAVQMQMPSPNEKL